MGFGCCEEVGIQECKARHRHNVQESVMRIKRLCGPEEVVLCLNY